MSNVTDRYEVSGYRFINGEKNPTCRDIKPFTKEGGNVGNSVSFTAIATVDDDFYSEIKKGDLLYFKANSQVGVNANGRSIVDEERGSCEDVAEVFAYYYLDELRKSHPKKFLIEPAEYVFAELEREYFGSIARKQTGGLLDIYKLYGCVSRNILLDKAVIVHGSELLSKLFDGDNVYASKNNTLYNYYSAYNAIGEDKNNIIHPGLPRLDVQQMLFKYFYSDTDEHCNNKGCQKIELKDGRVLYLPIKLLDNGGGMKMQSTNCQEFYKKQAELIKKSGQIDDYQDGIRTQFQVQYEFTAGKESFKNQYIRDSYDDLSYEEQLIALISQNKILYEDFKIFYEGVDLTIPFKRLRKHTSTYFMPELETVIPAAFIYKQKQISKAIAKLLNLEFEEDTFNSDRSYYLNQLSNMVLEDELTVHIASDEEIEKFNEKYGIADLNNQPALN